VSGEVQYGIYPLVDQGYKHGTRSVSFNKHEFYWGENSAGSERHYEYYIASALIHDGASAVIGKLGFKDDGVTGQRIKISTDNPLGFNSKLPDVLVITPESGNNQDYLQFAIGAQSWTDMDQKCHFTSDNWNMADSMVRFGTKA
jgi:hypothetical protein